MAIENNPVIVSLYQTGPWAVLTFHSVTTTLVTGLSFFMYGLIMRTGFPKTSKRVISTIFSTIFGGLVLLLTWSSLTLLTELLPNTFRYGSAMFFFMIGLPILLSSILATYFSTIIHE